MAASRMRWYLLLFVFPLVLMADLRERPDRRHPE
jgi:hypothetical protein